MTLSWEDMSLPSSLYPGTDQKVYSKKKKKVVCSLDDFCSCVYFQCSLGKLFEGSVLLLRAGLGAFVIS